MTGAKLPIVSDKDPLGEKAILVRPQCASRATELNLDLPSLGQEGYVIRTVGNRLVIAGGELRGNLYGVYGLLEDSSWVPMVHSHS